MVETILTTSLVWMSSFVKKSIGVYDVYLYLNRNFMARDNEELKSWEEQKC